MDSRLQSLHDGGNVGDCRVRHIYKTVTAQLGFGGTDIVIVLTYLQGMC